ncbi:hypothetical protein BsWGS_27233 [Bradybaena similaris]
MPVWTLVLLFALFESFTTEMSPRTPVEVPAPDGGWGWVIVACSFLIHMFVVGTLYSLSVVYVVWLDYFGDGKGITSWIISVAVALMFGIGPLPGALSRKFGNRAVVICGGVLMSSGLFLSYFAVSIYHLVVSVGVITGTGAGCCYLPSVSMVAVYFTTKRSMAMGISASGLGVGTFIMVPLLNWLLDYYGWRGCMLILSGISLNMCVLGALMQPPEKAPKCQDLCWQKSGHFTNAYFTSCPEEKQNSKEFSMSETCFGRCRNSSYFSRQNGLVDTSEHCSSTAYHELPQSEAMLPSVPLIIVSDHPSLNEPVDTVSVTGNAYPHHIADQSQVIQNNYAQRSGSQDMQTGSDKAYYSLGYYTLVSTPGFKNFQAKSVRLNRRCGRRVSCSAEILSHVKTPLSKQFLSCQIELTSGVKLPPKLLPKSRNNLTSLSDVQMMLSGSIGSLVFLEKSLSGKSKISLYSYRSMAGGHAASENFTSDTDLHSKDPEDIQQLTDGLEKTHATKLGASFNIYIHLVQDGAFVVFGLSNFMTNISFFMPVLYMVDRALNSGIEKGDAGLLISLYGAGNILGKLFFGWLADRKLVDRLFCYIACLTVCGVATCVSVLCGSSRELHSIYAFIFGFFIGAYVTLLPLVSIDLVGLPVVNESFSLLLCVIGVATVFGTPLAGWIFDLTGSYVISFVLHGVFLLVSALMLVPLMVMRKHTSTTTEL